MYQLGRDIFMSNNRIMVTRSSMPPYEDFIEKIKPLWDTHWLTNMGTYHEELEAKLVQYMDVPYVSLLVNGHMALEMVIQAMNFPEGSEVITTPFTFVSTTHAIVRNRLKPIFCDIKRDDYTIDEDKIEDLITGKTVAIVPVHVYGNICNVARIKEIAERHHLKVIYDAAHAFGEVYQGMGIGNFGDATIFSFHATKVFNTIEGGAVAFSDETLYERLYNLKNFGIRGPELVADVGANAKMNEFAAIMGLCNLPLVKENIALRKERVLWYIELLRNEEAIIKLMDFSEGSVVRNYGYFPVEFSNPELRDHVYQNLMQQGIYTRKYFYPLTSEAECFRGMYRDLPLDNARYVSSRILVLPLYPELPHEEIVRIVKEIEKTVKEFAPQ